MDSNLARHYVQSHKRLLLFDYDGTLAAFHPIPDLARPTGQLRRVLRQLCDDERNQVVIVSGRDRHFLDRHFSNLPLALTAEHGYLVRDNAGTWKPTVEQPADWKPLVRNYMQTASHDLPGAMIEEKDSSLVWHYYGAVRDGAATAVELEQRLGPHLPELGLIAQAGHKILEVRVAGVDKGQVAGYWLKQATWDFILAAGDDTTDEALFAALPDGAVSVKVRPGPTVAKYRAPDAVAFVAWLETLMVPAAAR